MSDDQRADDFELERAHFELGRIIPPAGERYELGGIFKVGSLDDEGRFVEAPIQPATLPWDPDQTRRELEGLARNNRDRLEEARRGAETVDRLREQANNRRGRHRVAPDVLRDAVQAHPRYGRPRAWTSVTDDVASRTTVTDEEGRKRRLSGRQVRRIIPDMKW